jgi:polysaccharide biosynthesis protein PslH
VDSQTFTAQIPNHVAEPIYPGQFPPTAIDPDGRAFTLPVSMQVEPAAVKRSVLIVSARSPLPMRRADQITVAHWIAYLKARGHAVDLYALDTGEGLDYGARQWLLHHCRHVEFVRQPLWRSLIGALLGAVKGKPLQISWFWNPLLARAVSDALAMQSYDALYCYYIRTADYGRGRGRIRHAGEKISRPVSILAMQLSQALNTRRMMETFTTRRDRLIYSIESKLLRKYEADIWQHFTHTVLIGEQDRQEVEKCCREHGISPIDNHFFCAHGVDSQRFKPDPNVPIDEDLCVFSGAMGTNTNINAVLWFVEKVWPMVQAGHPQARLMIVGRRPTVAVKALANKAKGIEVTGEVPDPADYIRRAAICIDPMRAGAGMQNKLLEYLACGKAVVATHLANEGIGAQNDRDVLLADRAEDFAQNILRLYTDPGLRQKLGLSARLFIEQAWGWEQQFRRLEELVFSHL